MKRGDLIVNLNIGKFYFSLVGWFDIIFYKKVLFRKQVNKKTVVRSYCLFWCYLITSFHFSCTLYYLLPLKSNLLIDIIKAKNGNLIMPSFMQVCYIYLYICIIHIRFLVSTIIFWDFFN